MELVVLVGSDHETWGQITGLVKKGQWDKIFFIGESLDGISIEKESELIKIKRDQRLVDLRDDIKKKLGGKIGGTEVALSIASGNGKEHMAVISALLTLPVGIRFAALTKEGIVQL